MEHTLNTHWEDDNGHEWDIRVMFDYQPSEPEEYAYPGCDSSVTINSVDRVEFVGDAPFSFYFTVPCMNEVNVKEMSRLELECHDLINKLAEEERDKAESEQ